MDHRQSPKPSTRPGAGRFGSIGWTIAVPFYRKSMLMSMPTHFTQFSKILPYCLLERTASPASTQSNSFTTLL
jgi:hypothetical protein